MHRFAVGTADSREPLLYITALYKLIDGGTDDRPPVAVLILKPFRIDPLKLIEMIPDNLEKRRGLRISGTVK